MHKHAVVPYEPLIAFANEEEITQENWQEVLNSLWGRPPRDEFIREWVKTYHRLGFMVPREWKGKRIAGPKPLQEAQRELRDDLTRLTDPEGQRRLSSKDQDTWEKSWEEAFWKAYEEALQQGREDRVAWGQKKAKDIPLPPGLKDLSWLLDKINGPTYEEVGGMQIRMRLTPLREMKIRMIPTLHRVESEDGRVSVTDPFSFVPVINDLRTWIYFRLAHLWSDGLFPRLGRCQHPKCRRFFLAKTERQDKRFCSQRCAQGVTAAERVKATRTRRAVWESIREDLLSALKEKKLGSLERRLKKAEQAFVAAYPRKKGPGYEEGEKLLAQAKRSTSSDCGKGEGVLSLTPAPLD